MRQCQEIGGTEIAALFTVAAPLDEIAVVRQAMRFSSWDATFIDLPMKKAPCGAFSFLLLAESEGFEPSMQVLPTYSLSRGAPSATRSRLQNQPGF